MKRYYALVLAALATLSAHASAVVPLAIADRRDYVFDSQGILYIATTGGSILRYNTQTNTYLSPFAIGGSPVGIDLSPDGQTLAVADASAQGTNNRIQLVNTQTGVATPVNFVRDGAESGTYMVAWGSNGKVMVTSSYSGSGWVPLRLHDPLSQTTTTLASVRQSTMLAASADRSTIGIAEANISNGPITAYSGASNLALGKKETGWFTFEVAVDRDGDKFIVPTYYGAFVYDRSGANFQEAGLVGQYANHGPLAAVFSPVNDVFFTSEWSFSGGDPHGVRVYNANTLALITTIDPYQFTWSGNGAMGPGRMDISPDGRYLVVSVENGARLYDVSAFTVPEPVSLALFSVGGVLLLMRRPRPSARA